MTTTAKVGAKVGVVGANVGSDVGVDVGVDVGFDVQAAADVDWSSAVYFPSTQLVHEPAPA